MELLVDTGSAWTWVPGDHCYSNATRAECQSTKQNFHPLDSETFERHSDRVSIAYGDGSVVSGNRVHDTVSIAQGPSTRAFDFMIDYNGDWNLSKGILGLAPYDNESDGINLVREMYE